MDTALLLTQVHHLGQAVEAVLDANDQGSASPLEQARAFVFTHLPQEPQRLYRADDLLEQLAPSPQSNLTWQEQRNLVIEGLAILHELWHRQPV